MTDILHYGWLGLAVIALVAAISVVWLCHELFTDKGVHAKPRRVQRHDKAELAAMMEQSLPDYDGDTFRPPPDGYYSHRQQEVNRHGDQY